MANTTPNNTPTVEDDQLYIEDVLTDDYVVNSVLKQLAAILEMLEDHLTLAYTEDTVYASTLRDGIEDTLDTTFEALQDYVNDRNAAIHTE